MRGVRLFWAVLCIALLLTGCAQQEAWSDGALWSDGAPLLQSPAVQSDDSALLDTVYTYLGSGITLKYPMGGEQSSPFLWWDVDDDGSQELLVLYQNTAKSKNVQMAVMRPGADGGWYAAHMDVEGAAGEVATLQLLQFEPEQDCLLAAFQDAIGLDWTVCLYQWEDGALRQRQSILCQQYAAVMLNGVQYLAVVQKNEAHGLLQLRLLAVDTKEIQSAPYPLAGAAERAGYLSEQLVYTLDARFERCLYLAPSLLDAEQTFVMDFVDMDGSSLAEVISYLDGRFARCFTDENLNIPNFTARAFTGLRPMDLDGDGTVELPRVESRVLGSGSNTRFYVVSWYAVSSGGTQLQGFGFADADAGYLLLLPPGWYNQVVLQPQGGSVWAVQAMDDGRQLMSFQLNTVNRTPSGFQLLGDLGRQQLYIRLEEMSVEEQQIILSGLYPLYK